MAMISRFMMLRTSEQAGAKSVSELVRVAGRLRGWMRTGLEEGIVVSLRVLLFKERVAVESNHLVGDAALSERVADGLGDKDDDLRSDGNVSSSRERCGHLKLADTHHRRQHIIKRACDLKHDDNNGDGHASDAAASQLGESSAHAQP